MNSLLSTLEGFNRRLARLAGWFAVAMMLLQAASVIVRYVFSYGLVTFQEAVVYGHALLFLFGAAYVLQRNEHVRVDVLYARLRPAGRRIVDLVALVVFVAPVCAAIAWVSVPYVAAAWATLEGSRQPGGLPAVWLLKAAILVFAVSLGLQALATAVRIARGRGDPHWQAHDARRGDGGL